MHSSTTHDATDSLFRRHLYGVGADPALAWELAAARPEQSSTTGVQQLESMWALDGAATLQPATSPRARR